MAEKAAWDFLVGLPQEERFEFVTVNPGLVLGPNLNECNFSSGDILKKIMTGGMPGIPDLSFPIVDVRDVAQAHLQGILVPEAAGKRFILVAESLKMIQIGQWLHEKWGKQFKVIHRGLPKFVLRIAALWDAEARTIVPHVGKVNTFDNS